MRVVVFRIYDTQVLRGRIAMSVLLRVEPYKLLALA
jgi:hypothetical protein